CIERSPNSKQKKRNASRDQQSGSVIIGGIRKKTDDTDEKEHKKHIRDFPDRRQISGNNRCNNCFNSDYPTIISVKPGTEIDGCYDQVPVQEYPKDG
ncbi:MAG: hypothetical protein K0Q73_9312, partial [Paenibacillus sp.]|nr:hypothetical protein [Paenibacillus sp.]